MLDFFKRCAQLFDKKKVTNVVIGELLEEGQREEAGDVDTATEEASKEDEAPLGQQSRNQKETPAQDRLKDEIA